MATATLIFPNQLNESLQIGDTVYYLNTTDHVLTDYEYTLNNSATAPAFTENQSGNVSQKYGTKAGIVELGMVTSITQGANTVGCYIGDDVTRPTTNSFIMFSKDSRANMSSLMGYFAEIEFINNSTTEAELYAVSSEIAISSQ